MAKTIFAFLLTSIYSISLGQDTVFEKSYNVNTTSEGKAIVKTSNDNFLLTGTTTDGVSDEVLLTKTDKNGSVIWSNSYDIGEEEVPKAIIRIRGSFSNVCNCNNYLIVGNTTPFGETDRDIFAMSVKGNNGQVLWAKSYGNASTDEVNDIAYPDVPNAQNDTVSKFVLTGSTARKATKFGTPTHDVLFLGLHTKYSASDTQQAGDIAWVKILKKDSANEEGKAITDLRKEPLKQRSIHNKGKSTPPKPGVRELVATGKLVDPPKEDLDDVEKDIFLISLNAGDGNINWKKRYAINGYEMGNAVTTDPTTGDILVTGNARKLIQVDPFLNSAGTGVFVMKTDLNGNVKWAKVHPQPNGWSDDAIDFIRANTISVSGGTNDYIVGGSYSSSSIGGAYLLNTNEKGETKWESLYTDSIISDVHTTTKMVNATGMFNQTFIRADIEEGATSCKNNVSTKNLDTPVTVLDVKSITSANMLQDTITPEISNRSPSIKDTLFCASTRGRVRAPDLTNEDLIDLHPNPADDIVFVDYVPEAVGGKLRIEHPTRGVVEQFKIKKSMVSPIQLDVANYNPGNYTIRLTKGSTFDVEQLAIL